MTVTLHAQPYAFGADGIYFESAEDWAAKAKDDKTHYGDPVEENEIQGIDGDLIDIELASGIIEAGG